VVYAHPYWREDYKSPLHPEIDGMNKINFDEINYFSAALPFNLFGRNFVASINYQRLYDMYKDLNFGYNYSGQFYRLDLDQSFEQRGGIKALAPAIAYQVTPRFSVGATFNIWTDKLFWDNQWVESTRARGHGAITIPFEQPFETDTQIYDKFDDFEGFNMNFGFLWEISRIITVGAVYKTPFTAHLTYDHSYVSTQFYPTLNRTVINFAAPPTDKQRLKMPASFGLGVALRFSDAFTWSCDVYRTQWSRFFRGDIRDVGERSDIDNRSRSRSNVDDTTQVRTGCEYLFILEKTLIPLRAGLFLDPRPSHKAPDTFWGFSLGSGVMIGNFVVDYAYTFRTGNGVDGGLLGVPNSKADIDQNTFLLSVIYHFE
jgi:long-subunit fatty acid transport protein